MAKKLEVFYIRNLELRPLNIEDLKNIIGISPSIRLNWGKEYVDFYFTSPSETDVDVESAIKLFGGGKIPIGLFPSSGSYSLLGRGVSSNSIDIKIYNLKEFCELSRRFNELVSMNIPFSKSSNSLGFIYKDLFDDVKVVPYADYSWIITDLEKNGYVTTHQSENILRTDERKFTLTKKCEGYPNLESYVGKTFEVDSLGTSFHKELTQGIFFLSSRYFKDTSSRS